MRGFKDNKDIKKKDLLFSSAFTLVELIVVVVIIAILATIGVVGYSSWRQSTATAQLKSDLNGVTAAMENARTFGNTYPTIIPSTFIPSSGVTLSGGGLNSGEDYCVDATNETQSYHISSLYTTPLAGTCPVLNSDAGISASYPGTGNTWTDLSGNGNNGTLTNGVGYSTSSGGTLTFDGVDDWVNVGNLGTFYNQGTIAFWMNASVVENYRNPFTTKYNGSNSGIRFEENSSGSFSVAIGNDVGTYTGGGYLSSGLTANTWYHVVLVWDKVNNNIKGYLNGVSKFNQSQTLWPTTLPAVAIGNGYSSTRYWLGLISSVSIYSRALSVDEVQQNFNTLRGRYGI